MEYNSKLVPASIKAQCSAGIIRLQEDNQALDIAQKSIENFITDDSIQSVSFQSLKQQLADYQSIISCMKSANDNDIEDYQFLSNAVGTDVLDGKVVELKRVCENNVVAVNAEIDRLSELCYEVTPLDNVLGVEYKQQITELQKELESYEATISYCSEVIKEYDEIEGLTQSLFQASVPLRNAARNALLDLRTTFGDDGFTPNLNAPWRKEIKECVLCEQFKDTLQQEFGFDDKTVTIIWEVYSSIQVKYASETQEKRDWYFARSLSQMGGYSNLDIQGIETDGWQKGARLVFGYNYDDEKAFFCDELGINVEDFEYMRQMVRLQHQMCSAPEKHNYRRIKNKLNKDVDFHKEFDIWKYNMEKATNIEYSNEEYLVYYETLYTRMADKGDFSHMLYTISSSLIESEDGAVEKWELLEPVNMQWENYEERIDIAGWLGDAVYTGSNIFDPKVSFSDTDYIADLDADNIIHRLSDNSNLMTTITTYYQELSDETSKVTRKQEFLANNPYEMVEKAILDRIGIKDKNGDGKIDYLDLENNEIYSDTYKFLKKLLLNEDEGNVSDEKTI